MLWGPNRTAVTKPVVGPVMFDCFSPRALASFYEGFLEALGRVEDTTERVVVDLGDEKLPSRRTLKTAAWRNRGRRVDNRFRPWR